MREIEAQADAFLGRIEIVVLDPVAGEHGYTTRELLLIEHELLDGPIRRRGSGVGLAAEGVVADALNARPILSNHAPEPLRDGDLPLHVAGLLADSRAEHLALDRRRPPCAPYPPPRRSRDPRRRAAMSDRTGHKSAQHPGPAAHTPNRRTRPLKHESPLARGGFRIAGAGFEPATFGL